MKRINEFDINLEFSDIIAESDVEGPIQCLLR